MAGDTYRRSCSECGELLPSNRPNAKTCSDRCRAKRSRRIRRVARENGAQASLPDHQVAVAKAVRHDTPDIAHKVIQEELRPVVREAITEDVMRALNDMVALAPDAVAALAHDLHSYDSKVRQKAYDLWLRYTVGHNAIVRPEEGVDSKQLVVNFNLPRPEGGAGGETQQDEIVDAEELRSCNLCGLEKPKSQFVAASDRCVTCHEQMQARAKELLAE